MKKKKQKRNYNEVNYWESMADSMVGLLLCVLLITMLLIMYLVRVPDNDYVDVTEGDNYEAFQDSDPGGGNHAYGQIDDSDGDAWETGHTDGTEDSGDDGGGLSGGGGGEDNENYKYEDPDPGAGEGDGSDRAAVLVQVVDGETGRTIKKVGMQFELYGSNSALQVLSTYYPKKVDYKNFQTDSSGTFYLPEKIVLAGYQLHALSTIEGYDLAENIDFTIDKSYDWDDPFVVSVPVYPSKNSISIQVKDVDNGEAVTGATFNVVATEDIVTQDGTTRYKEGKIVDTISVDEDGAGESSELYLGNYLLRQDEVPQYYAKITADTPVTVKSKSDASTKGVQELSMDRTNVKVVVTDALKNSLYLEGARFTLTEDGGRVVNRLTTDKNGRFTVTDLKKNTTYHIQQLSTASDYQVDPADHTFTVNGEGLIDGNSETELTVRNRIIRISIGIKDQIFQGQVSDVNVALRDSEGNVVKTWSTTGMELTLEGIPEGEYQIIINGNENQASRITVRDVTEIQEFQFRKWTIADIGTLLALGLICIGLVALTVVTTKHHKQRKQEEKD